MYMCWFARVFAGIRVSNFVLVVENVKRKIKNEESLMVDGYIANCHAHVVLSTNSQLYNDSVRWMTFSTIKDKFSYIEQSSLFSMNGCYLQYI